ncbi:MAG: TPMT family class I SAM-dependent methyltransferase [Planctomycetota bacterium]|nr:TPMT family class I SAM-dependent methyltransferase [Planctomycetota bacterium]
MDHDVSDARYWTDRYREGTAGWDLGGPCPVFVDWLDRAGSPVSGRVAFPGCGHGHDLRFWLARGFDAVGFDFARFETDLPVERLDVFDLGRAYPAAFDVIVEYTCYCAIDPARRTEYALALRSALKPGGLLVALLFPVEEREGGPPYGVDESEIGRVLGVGLTTVSIETPASSVEPRRDRERLAVFRKPDDPRR